MPGLLEILQAKSDLSILVGLLHYVPPRPLLRSITFRDGVPFLALGYRRQMLTLGTLKGLGTARSLQPALKYHGNFPLYLGCAVGVC